MNQIPLFNINTIIKVRSGYRRYPRRITNVGYITRWKGKTIPSTYEICDGREVSVDKYPELYDIIGNTYGGIIDTTFKFPDYRGKTSVLWANPNSRITPEYDGDDNCYLERIGAI